MNVLIAPHPDDELIGSFSLFKRGLIDWVIYVNPTPERFECAKVVGEELGFSVDYLEFKNLYPYLGKARHRGYTCLVPDSTDNHPLHKAINLLGRMSGCRLGYYTTDMNTGYTRELSKKEQKEKRGCLNKYYPDQKSLWEHDWKYFLFEGVVFERERV